MATRLKPAAPEIAETQASLGLSQSELANLFAIIEHALAP